LIGIKRPRETPYMSQSEGKNVLRVPAYDRYH
jgi:hypothetical protein